jgi:hypothetical protein
MIEDARINKNKQFAVAILIISIVLIATFLIIYEENQAPANENQAIIYYSLSTTPYFFNSTGTKNYIVIYSANTGKTTGDFSLVIKFVNATFSTITEQPYTQINTTLAEFKWDLNAGDSVSKDVYFSINSTVASFSISLLIHSNQSSLKAISEPPIFLQYKWDVYDFQLNQ